MGFFDIFLNVSVLERAFPMLLRGLWYTLALGLTAIIFGSVFGVLIALVRLYAPQPLRLVAVFYIDIIRAIPVLVLLILIYYALPFAGVTLGSFPAAAAALILVLAAFTAEVVRAGIQAVPKGQFEAAEALGLSFVQLLRKVILPQAIRIVIPPHASNCVSVMKDTALASVVALSDLLKQATDAQALFANPSPLIGAAAIYVVMLWPLVRFTSYLERRAARAYLR